VSVLFSIFVMLCLVFVCRDKIKERHLSLSTVDVVKGDYRINRFTYALLELKLNTDQKTVITAYYAYAHSWLSYGIILWGNSTSMN
jgi:hypothetical protein